VLLLAGISKLYTDCHALKKNKDELDLVIKFHQCNCRSEKEGQRQRETSANLLFCLHSGVDHCLPSHMVLAENKLTPLQSRWT